MRLLRCCSRIALLFQFFTPSFPRKAGIQRVGNGVSRHTRPPRFRTSTAASVNVNTPLVVNEFDATARRNGEESGRFGPFGAFGFIDSPVRTARQDARRRNPRRRLEASRMRSQASSVSRAARVSAAVFRKLGDAPNQRLRPRAQVVVQVRAAVGTFVIPHAVAHPAAWAGLNPVEAVYGLLYLAFVWGHWGYVSG